MNNYILTYIQYTILHINKLIEHILISVQIIWNFCTTLYIMWFNNWIN